MPRNYETGPIGEGASQGTPSFSGETRPALPESGIVSPDRVARESKPARRHVISPQRAGTELPAIASFPDRTSVPTTAFPENTNSDTTKAESHTDHPDIAGHRKVIAAAQKDGDEGKEVRARVPEEEIPQAEGESQDQSSFRGGESITGPSGAGEFVGYEDRPQGRYAVVKIGNVETRVPEARFNELYSKTEPAQEAPDADEQDERTRLRSALDSVLGRVREYSTDSLSVSYASEDVEGDVQTVLAEAREKGFVFRSDLRHPTDVFDESRELGAAGGVFTDGFKADSDGTRSSVHTAPDPETVLEYPDPNALPADWDGKKFIYVIDSNAILNDPRSVTIGQVDIANSVSIEDAVGTTGEVREFESGDINPGYVAYAMEVDESNPQDARIVRVIKNGDYLTFRDAGQSTEDLTDPLAIRKHNLRVQLERDIDDISAGYDADQVGLVYNSDRARERVANLMQTAREKRFIFHTDTRHPLRVKPADRARGATAGIFDAGLVAQSDEPGFGVFTTPSVAIAMRYPERHEVPDDWDGKKYLYFVDIEGVIDDPERTHRELGVVVGDQPQLVEIESGTIAPNRIAHCLEIDSTDNRLLRIFSNKDFED